MRPNRWEYRLKIHEEYLINLLNEQMIRYYLTGALDHAQRLFKSNLLDSPLCPLLQQDEAAKHIFWDCTLSFCDKDTRSY